MGWRGVVWCGVVWCGRGRVRRGGVEEEFRSLKQVNNWKLHFLILLSVPWKSENRLRGKEGGREGGRAIFPYWADSSLVKSKWAGKYVVTVSYRKDCSSGLPFDFQRAVWVPCMNRKGNHVKSHASKQNQNQK